MSLGQKIGRLRQERGLTLQEVSDGSDLTPSFLSRLERDKVNISVANLRKLALFFNVPMTYFFEGEENEQIGYLTRASERIKLSLDDAPVQVFSLLPSNGDMEARLTEAHSGSGQQGFSSKGGQMIFLLRGQLRYNLGEEEYILETGDTLYYHRDLAHTWVNIGNEPALVLSVTCLTDRDER